MNFTFVNYTARSSLWIKVLRKSIDNKSASLSCFRIVGEAFLKSLSIFEPSHEKPVYAICEQ